MDRDEICNELYAKYGGEMGLSYEQCYELAGYAVEKAVKYAQEKLDDYIDIVVEEE